jgi:hypothetical protein
MNGRGLQAANLGPGFEDRFWSKVDKSGDCWLWTGSKQSAGYGMIWCRPRQCSVLAHVASFALAHGEALPKREILHECDNPSCVNPDHLTQGTHADNLADAARKGRMSSGPEHARKVLAGMRLGDAHPRVRLSDKQVQEIRQRRAAGEGCRSLGRAFGVSHQLVSAVAEGKKRKHSPGL